MDLAVPVLLQGACDPDAPSSLKMVHVAKGPTYRPSGKDRALPVMISGSVRSARQHQLEAVYVVWHSFPHSLTLEGALEL
jgi:hypothetical protein